MFFSFFFFNVTATTEIYTLSLHDALPISGAGRHARLRAALRVLGPTLGQVQDAVDQQPRPAGGIRQEHRYLAVVDLPEGAGILASHAHRGSAFLANPVSSTISTPSPAPPSSAATTRSSTSRSASASHWVAPSSRCIRPGSTCPTCCASHQQFLRPDRRQQPST